MEDIFKCKRCGYCCHGETTVSLDQKDIERLVDFLRLPLAEATEKYLRVTDGVTQMKVVDGHCIFYRDGCMAHPGRPWRCRQWPLHPSILIDEGNFSAISYSCPGIAKDLDYEDFCHRLAELYEKKRED